MIDEIIEKELIEKNLTSPRVTLENVEQAIVGEYYYRGHEPFENSDYPIWKNKYGVLNTKALSLLTFCVLELENGFTVTGESACVSHENFDVEIGRKIARQNAVNKIWPLMGYELKERIHRQKSSEQLVFNNLNKSKFREPIVVEPVTIGSDVVIEPNLHDGKWHMVSVIREENQYSIFIDDKQVDNSYLSQILEGELYEPTTYFANIEKGCVDEIKITKLGEKNFILDLLFVSAVPVPHLITII